jgi:hypothetical protein
MGKFKTGVIAAMLLCGTSVFANNFRGGDQVYVPAVGHLGGAGATFVSDIFISNLESDSAVDVSIIFSQGDNTGTPNITTFRNGDGTGFTLTLQPRERREIIDFVSAPKSTGGLGLNCTTAACFGDAVFNACLSGKDCTPDPNTGTNANFRNISVESRIYAFNPANGTATTSATTGQLFNGFGWYSYASSDGAAAGLDKVFITGLRNNTGTPLAGTYRGNVGFVNASQFSTTTLRVQLFDGKTGNQIGSDVFVPLGPLGIAQKNIGAMFPSFTGSTATNAWLLVTQDAGATTPTGDALANGCGNGCPAFFAYGSVLDNVTSDATTLESQYTRPLSDAAINCIYNQTCKGAFNPKRAAKH